MSAAIRGDEGLAEIAELCVSELVTNAVLHAVTDVAVVVDVTDRRFRVTVVDGSTGEPRLRPLAPDSVTGRGLHIVAALAHRWGFAVHPAGKAVWFELDRTRDDVR